MSEYDPRDPPRRLPVVGLERPGDLAVQARGQADEPGTVLGKVVAVDARLVVVAVDVGVGDDAAEVLVARPVLRQQDEMEGLGVLAPLPVGHGPASDVRLDPDDGLDALLLTGLVERHRSVQGPVIGDGQGVEAESGRLRCQVIDAPEAVEQAELRVDVEVREVVRGDGHLRVHGSPAAPGRAQPCNDGTATAAVATSRRLDHLDSPRHHD